ncbi:MAG: hypothetical protein NW224_17345 [Leptolyngbyaceae cyanobacterium bins.302]|nr:hypothetical protein [Leptolyngbyaceae cyanobacterium bins.302]
MNVEEFRNQSRITLEAVLNQLQSATLLVTELEAQITDAGRTVQHLSHVVEQFLNQQLVDSSPESVPPQETGEQDRTDPSSS